MHLDYTLTRNTFGQLELRRGDAVYPGVTAVRAFPIGAPEHGLSLVSPDGHELAWIHHLSELPAEMRALIEAAGFPTERIQRVTGFADRKPAVRNPVAVQNSRLEIILLRRGK